MRGRAPRPPPTLRLQPFEVGSLSRGTGERFAAKIADEEPEEGRGLDRKDRVAAYRQAAEDVNVEKQIASHNFGLVLRGNERSEQPQDDHSKDGARVDDIGVAAVGKTRSPESLQPADRAPVEVAERQDRLVEPPLQIVCVVRGTHADEQ